MKKDKYLWMRHGFHRPLAVPQKARGSRALGLTGEQSFYHIFSTARFLSQWTTNHTQESFYREQRWGQTDRRGEKENRKGRKRAGRAWQGVTALVKARSVIGLLCRLSGLSPEGQIVSHAQFPYLAKICSDGKGLLSLLTLENRWYRHKELEDTIKPSSLAFML